MQVKCWQLDILRHTTSDIIWLPKACSRTWYCFSLAEEEKKKNSPKLIIVNKLMEKYRWSPLSFQAFLLHYRTNWLLLGLCIRAVLIVVILFWKLYHQSIAWRKKKKKRPEKLACTQTKVAVSSFRKHSQKKKRICMSSCSVSRAFLLFPSFCLSRNTAS